MIKNLLVISVIGSAAPALGVATLESSFRLVYQGRVGYHLRGPVDLATHRHALEVRQRAEVSQFSMVSEARADVEGAYGDNSRYHGFSIQEDSSELSLGEVYGQYKSGAWTIRLGNQVVQWSNSISPYYGDAVNPKDLREAGLSEASRQRVATPMLMVRSLLGPVSLQGIWGIRPSLNIYPKEGSDFAPRYRELFQPVSVDVKSGESLPWSINNQEFGLKVSSQVGKLEGGLYYLYAMDRTPVRELNVTATGLELTASASRIHVLGQNLTLDWGPLVSRTEVVWLDNRLIGIRSAGSVVQVPSDQLTWLVGLDVTQYSPWRFTLEVAQSLLLERIDPLFEANNRQWVSSVIYAPLYRESGVECLLSYAPRDGSALGSLKFIIPLSSSLEGVLGVDYFAGSQNSVYGSFSNGSRMYGSLRFFAGEG